MTATVEKLSTAGVAERAWRISRLVNECCMDRNAALFSLSLLYQQAGSDAVRRLCVGIAERIGGVPLHHRQQTGGPTHG